MDRRRFNLAIQSQKSFLHSSPSPFLYCVIPRVLQLYYTSTLAS
nr:MAG TPA: hypothetical protein [Caudoviricetes sp.]